MPSAKQTAAPFVPSARSLPVLREAVQLCQGCDLYRKATQAVFGELETGTKAAKPTVAIMMIGEQPGDQEDLQGRPFVGPRRQIARQMPGRGADRPAQGLCDQHGQAFSMGASRQTSHSQETKHAGNPRVQTMAGRGAGNGSTAADCLPGRCGGAIAVGRKLQDHAVAWQNPDCDGAASHPRDLPSICYFARPHQ